jgi:hypothetical protein
MFEKLEYDGLVKRLNRAAGVLFALMVLGTVLAPGAQAQINAAPPSVTSLGFGGRAINGTPPSVTSLGAFGYTPGFNPAFPNSRPVIGTFPNQPLDGHHHHHHNGFYPWGGAVYAMPYYGYYDTGDQAANDEPEEQYNGGPTIFDRRGPGRVARPPAEAYEEREPAQASYEPPPAAPARDEPQTVLVFKDGHQLELENYAIVGSTLYDLTDGRRHKISLSDLDLGATTKQNDDRGIDFQVPSGTE